ncbi:MAG: 50S ribosomal protein L21 [Candidatus Dojkabacteria bacterium]|uniref:Large ribosomal subunit protein bL21 n=2 Tax=Candidatus Dojkabacteria TaxID=74243 RepID=A0A136KE21_9BACT|nr:MAG: 50S ribosomal protein L21 [candidate division WS6 bacterium OLB21]MBW7953433.1 50S ribosomal protein L21 [Candidatus Dojkabacteria bacterium]WKZ28230.1 MAG: 50S ribosomal protein L21 [Candidatus Dojkabacteria bacterium]
MKKSDKFAVIKINNAQFKVEEGSVVETNRLAGNEGDKMDITEVLLLSDSGKVSVGTPYVEKATVKAEIVEHIRGEKIRMMTYKAKARSRRRVGHRQELTKVKITKIS